MEIYARQKSLSVKLLDKNLVAAEAVLKDPVHEIKVVLYLTIPDAVISDARAEFIHCPWDMCPETAGLMSRIVGMRLGRGILKKVKDATARGDGCSHMADLISEALKGMVQARFRLEYHHLGPEQRASATRADLKGTCHAFSNPERQPIPAGEWVKEKPPVSLV